MGIGKTNVGGGTALNFKVVPGLTQPETAAENTIWVETERIGAWYFSVTQPEEPQEWDVWFLTGTSGWVEFNALKKNGIQVYPISAKQCVGGAWVTVKTMRYQGEEWQDLITYLYNEGNEFTDITGGWIKVNGTLTKNSNNLTLTNVGASASNYAAAYTNKKIDLTKVKEIRIIASGTNAGIGPSCFLFVAETQTTSKSGVAEVGLETTMQEHSLDVSSLTGSYYIGILAAGSSAFTHTAIVQKLWVKE